MDSSDAERYVPEGYRIDDNKPNQIYINKNRPLMFGYMTRLALTEMMIQWDTPNVNFSNNTLTMGLFSATDATPPVITTLPPVRITLPNSATNIYYSNQDLATVVQTAINANASITALFGASAFTVTATVFGGFNFELTGAGVNYPSGRTRGYFNFIAGDASSTITGLPKVQYDLLYTMGIVPREEQYTRYTTGLAPMCFTPYVDVVSNLLTKNRNVADGTTAKTVTSSKLARIYFTNEEIQPIIYTDYTTNEIQQVGSYPFIMRREFKVPKQIQWNTTENVDVIDIQVLDFKGNPVYIEPVDRTDNPAPNPNNLNRVVEESNTVFRFTLTVTEN